MADVVLVGLPGSGKTTTGRALAASLGCAFVDTDDVFFEREHVSVQDFLRAHDQSQFREREVQALVQALGVDGVVATGGGIVTTLAARQLLREQMTVWLDCPNEILATRILDGDRPLLEGDRGSRLVELRALRDDLYEEVSHHKVDSSGPLDHVVGQIRRIIEGEQAAS